MTQERVKPSEKILTRIRNLLAMGSDRSSENEAAIALERARKLMDEYQVTLSDIDSLDDGVFGSAVYKTGSKRKKLWMNLLAIAVADLNDCIVKAACDKQGHFSGYKFVGFAEDTAVCEFMLVYLVDTCNRLYRRDKEVLNLRGLAEKNDYLDGLTQGIKIRIYKIINDRQDQTLSDGRSLVVFKKAAVEAEFGEGRYRTVKSRELVCKKAYNIGINTADEVHLGSFLPNDRKSAGAIAQ